MNYINNIFLLSVLLWIPTQVQAISCARVFENTSVFSGELAFLNETGTQTTVRQIEAKMREESQFKSPVPITEPMQRFREQFLPALKMGGTFQEGVIRSMEATLRVRSFQLGKNLSSKKSAEFDFIIVGAGVHGITTLHKLLSINPNYKILVVESTNTGGANFRKAGDGFNINSSSRPSGKGILALPGRGNINELPGSPIQVTDLSPVKYATSGTLGSVLVTSLYAAASRYSGVEVLFDTTVTKAKWKPGNKFPGIVKLKSKKYDKLPDAKAQKVIFASGLGKPKRPNDIAQDLKEFPELARMSPTNAKLPRVIDFEVLMRILARDPNPKRFFKNKRIGVAGTGDSANVFIEFLLGYAAKEAYGFSDAQTAGPKKVFWIGQTIKACEAYIEQARLRYSQLGTGFRSSDPAVEAVIEGVSAKLTGVEPAGKKKVDAMVEGGKLTDLDLVVLTTGYSNNLVKVLKHLLPEGEAQGRDTLNLFDLFGKFLEGETTVSNGETVRVARQFPADRRNGEESPFSIVGPAAGKLPTDAELLGVVQNFVSIFNNAPRSAAGAELAAQGVQPLARGVKRKSNIAEIESNLTRFNIGSITPIRLTGETLQAYLKQNFVTTLNELGIRALSETGITLRIQKDKKRLVATVEGAATGRQANFLVQGLASSKDFFDMIYASLKVANTDGLVIQVKPNDSGFSSNNVGIVYGFSGIESAGKGSVTIKNE